MGHPLGMFDTVPLFAPLCLPILPFGLCSLGERGKIFILFSLSFLFPLSLLTFSLSSHSIAISNPTFISPL
jgi:hypothetical protein